MESIISSSKEYDSFDFSRLQLVKPTLVSGGNYFIKCLLDENPLYIQPPKCSTKQGIIKTSGGKRFYTDLMFTNENEAFIHWMEKLEAHCQQTIFKNREQWFDNELELDDIESYFTSPLKLFKSGKYYIARINITTLLGKPTIKIYNEDEEEINFETINDKTNIMTILEIQGIKCSAKSFQIEIELKQMMALKQQILFDKCLFKTKEPRLTKPENEPMSDKETPLEKIVEAPRPLEPESEVVQEPEPEPEPEPVPSTLAENVMVPSPPRSLEEGPSPSPSSLPLPLSNLPKKPNEMEEIDFPLEELPETETVQIKQRNEVYYEMYREARKKAKIARDLALTAYLEAKNIKNTYMLTDLDSESESDNELGEVDADDQDLIHLENDIEEFIEPAEK
jgi:hypothetical protein